MAPLPRALKGAALLLAAAVLSGRPPVAAGTGCRDDTRSLPCQGRGPVGHVFIDGAFHGGAADACIKWKKGELQPLLETAGAKPNDDWNGYTGDPFEFLPKCVPAACGSSPCSPAPCVLLFLRACSWRALAPTYIPSAPPALRRPRRWMTANPLRSK